MQDGFEFDERVVDRFDHCPAAPVVAKAVQRIVQRRGGQVADYEARRTMMVDTQIRPSDVTKFPIIDAMLSVPRERFVPDDLREAAYVGENIVLSEGRVLLEPRTFAKMLDALDIQPNESVLDIGCGLGYSAAVLAKLAGFVVAVEQDEQQANEAQTALSELSLDQAVVVSGSLADGAAKSGPYDVILIEGAIEVLPSNISSQIKDGGRIAAIFAEGDLGVVRIGHMRDGQLHWRFAFNAGAPVLSGFEKKPSFAL